MTPGSDWRATRSIPRSPSSACATARTSVTNLQRRVAGVLPVRVDVPRAGTLLRFVRPLVLDKETKVTFRYRGR